MGILCGCIDEQPISTKLAVREIRSLEIVKKKNLILLVEASFMSDKEKN